MEEEVYLTILYDYYGALLTEKQRLYFTYYYFANIILRLIHSIIILLNIL